jgi:hypothetical protein
MEASKGQDTTTVPSGGAVRGPTRSLVLVCGSGRSGTSLFTGILSRLGFHVPQPEVQPDDTNPRGFAESKWVVDFHTGLLKRAGVQVSDARPGAWARTAQVALDEDVRRDLREWLETEFREADHVIIKDPRLSWFLPLWRHCAEALGVAPRFASVLRHPAAVVESKQRSYGNWQGDVDRTAGWLNQVLFTERATREGPRAFVRYDDLLDDWTSAVARVGEELDLELIRDAPATAIVQVHEFVDRALSRSRTTWDDFEIPARLREQADGVWELMSRLVDDHQVAGSQPLVDALEEARAAYIALYEDAEAIAQSSIAAAHRRPAAPRGRASRSVMRIARRVPKRYRRKLPLRWRVTVVRSLNRSGAGGR